MQRLSIIFYIWRYPRYYTGTLGFGLWPPLYLGITIDFRATPLSTLFTLSFFGDHPQNTCILDIPGTYGSAAILLTNHATAGILFTNHTYFVHKPRYSTYFAHKPRYSTYFCSQITLLQLFCSQITVQKMFCSQSALQQSFCSQTRPTVIYFAHYGTSSVHK